MPQSPEYEQHPPSDDALVVQASSGDADAFGELVVRYASRVAGLIYQHVGDPEATRDIGQAVFVKAWRKIKTLKHTGRFRAWLFRIAVNESLEFIRSQYARKRASLEISDTPMEVIPAKTRQPVERLIAEEERLAVVAALDTLPPRQRSVFVLKHFHGESNQQTAEVLSCSIGAVKANLSYALKSLRERFAGDDTDE